MADEFEILIQGFRFDLWANQEWLTYLRQQGLGDPDMSIMRHVLSAQEVWRRRCYGESVTSFPDVPFEEMEDLSGRWTSMLSTRTDDPVIEFQRMDGTPNSLRFSRIARHVIDHGTYHRGELRGLCRARNATDFPETGLMLYYLKHGLAE